MPTNPDGSRSEEFPLIGRGTLRLTAPRDAKPDLLGKALRSDDGGKSFEIMDFADLISAAMKSNPGDVFYALVHPDDLDRLAEFMAGKSKTFN